MEPLYATAEHPTLDKFTRVVFLNDVLYCKEDILKLLWHGADMACGYDYSGSDFGTTFYDAWVFSPGNYTVRDEERLMIPPTGERARIKRGTGLLIPPVLGYHMESDCRPRQVASAVPGKPPCSCTQRPSRCSGGVPRPPRRARPSRRSRGRSSAAGTAPRS